MTFGDDGPNNPVRLPGLAGVGHLSFDDAYPLDMHYPHRISKVKRARKCGFRARMRTKNGRKIINAKRRLGRKVQIV